MTDPTPTPAGDTEEPISESEKQLRALMNAAEHFANFRATLNGMVQGMIADGWGEDHARATVFMYVASSIGQSLKEDTP